MKILNTLLDIELTDDEEEIFNYAYIKNRSPLCIILQQRLILKYDDIDLLMNELNKVQNTEWKSRCHDLLFQFKKVLIENGVYTEIMKRRQYNKMFDVAEKYYTLLKDGENANTEQKEKLKIELDKLSAPFSNNSAYYAFLKMERMAAGL